MTKFSFLGSSADEHQTCPPLQILSFQTSATNHDTTMLSRVDANGATFPLFSYTKTKKSLHLNRIGAGSSIIQPTPIAGAKFHTWSHTDLTIGGQDLLMKERDGIGGYKLDHPQFGKLKWHDNKEKGGYVLEDAQETRIARYRPGVGKSVIGGFLEVYVSVDDHFLDLIVLFTLAMIAESDDFNDEVKETASNLKTTEHIVSALGGGGS